ncbi:hypothetical protein B0A55_11339, partial [Friedmanniomyces simplex]
MSTYPQAPREPPAAYHNGGSDFEKNPAYEKDESPLGSGHGGEYDVQTGETNQLHRSLKDDCHWRRDWRWSLRRCGSALEKGPGRAGRALPRQRRLLHLHLPLHRDLVGLRLRVGLRHLLADGLALRNHRRRSHHQLLAGRCEREYRRVDHRLPGRPLCHPDLRRPRVRRGRVRAQRHQDPSMYRLHHPRHHHRLRWRADGQPRLHRRSLLARTLLGVQERLPRVLRQLRQRRLRLRRHRVGRPRGGRGGEPAQGHPHRDQAGLLAYLLLLHYQLALDRLDRARKLRRIARRNR